MFLNVYFNVVIAFAKRVQYLADLFELFDYEIPVAVILSLRRISANQTADSSQAQNDILRLGARPYTVIVVLNYAK